MLPTVPSKCTPNCVKSWWLTATVVLTFFWHFGFFHFFGVDVSWKINVHMLHGCLLRLLVSLERYPGISNVTILKECCSFLENVAHELLFIIARNHVKFFVWYVLWVFYFRWQLNQQISFVNVDHPSDAQRYPANTNIETTSNGLIRLGGNTADLLEFATAKRESCLHDYYELPNPHGGYNFKEETPNFTESLKFVLNDVRQGIYVMIRGGKPRLILQLANLQYKNTSGKFRFSLEIRTSIVENNHTLKNKN